MAPRYVIDKPKEGHWEEHLVAIKCGGLLGVPTAFRRERVWVYDEDESERHRDAEFVATVDTDGNIASIGLVVAAIAAVLGLIGYLSGYFNFITKLF